MPEPAQLTADDAQDALVGGDRELVPGTARAALRHRDFRVLYIGAFASNIGTWMQNVVLAAYAFELEGSATFVGIIVFAQLGPMLLLSMVGGLLADVVDRRRLLIGAALWQMALSLGLAVLATDDDPSRVVLVALVFGIGAAQAIHAPTYSSVLPSMVGPRDLPGAISLNSTQMNASRVVGPAIGGALYAAVGVSWVFTLNAATYLAVIGTLVAIRLPPVDRDPDEPRGLRRLLGGVAAARADPLVGGILVTIVVFSLFALPFATQMPVIAERNLGIDPESSAYGLFYASMGIGAVLGSLSIGTVLHDTDRGRIVTSGFAGFSVTLATLALLREPALAYPVGIAVGGFYFAVVTALATVLQEQLDDRVRGRVMALWIMGFGGTVPIGGLIAGPIIEATSVRVVMLAGAATGAGLGLWVHWRLRRRRRRLAVAG